MFYFHLLQSLLPFSLCRYAVFGFDRMGFDRRLEMSDFRYLSMQWFKNGRSAHSKPLKNSYLHTRLLNWLPFCTKNTGRVIKQCLVKTLIYSFLYKSKKHKTKQFMYLMKYNFPIKVFRTMHNIELTYIIFFSTIALSEINLSYFCLLS